LHERGRLSQASTWLPAARRLEVSTMSSRNAFYSDGEYPASNPEWHDGVNCRAFLRRAGPDSSRPSRRYKSAAGQRIVAPS